jgi:iron-sulfur cluster repair protein YtfE (RIC family)
MTRSPALVPLSHDHHHGLVAAQRLKRGEPAAPGVDLRESVDQLWRAELAPHFEQEERILFPACTGPQLAPMTQRALDDHAAIRQLVVRITEAPAEERGSFVISADLADRTDLPVLTALATDLGKRLERHIRFEERELFPAIQECLLDDRLVQIGEEIKRARGSEAGGS